MKKGLLIVLLTAINYCNSVIGPVCLDCKGINRPEDCNIVVKCGEHEMCFIEQYVTNGGLVLYNVGCKDIALCNLASSNGFGKRRIEKSTRLKRNDMKQEVNHSTGRKRDDIVVCSECCNSKSICNQAGCRLPPVNLPTGSKLCYKCLSSTQPDACTQLALCSKDQYCSVSEQKNLLGQLRWKHDCIEKQLCINTSSPCSQCCNTELCNDKCLSVNTTQIPIAGISKTTLTTLPTSTRTTTETPTTHLTTVPSTTSKPTTTTQTSTTTIPLSVPIIIQLDRRPDRISIGDTVVIFCMALGNPIPTYDFKFQDGPLPPNARVKNNTLTLSNFLLQNNGNYECVASNSLGTGNYGFILHLS